VHREAGKPLFFPESFFLHRDFAFLNEITCFFPFQRIRVRPMRVKPSFLSLNPFYRVLPPKNLPPRTPLSCSKSMFLDLPLFPLVPRIFLDFRGVRFFRSSVNWLLLLLSPTAVVPTCRSGSLKRARFSLDGGAFFPLDSSFPTHRPPEDF